MSQNQEGVPKRTAGGLGEGASGPGPFSPLQGRKGS